MPRTPLLTRAGLPLSAAFLLLSAIYPHPRGEEDGLDFRRDVQPILADRCFACHGPDAATREADLRLDVKADVLADRGGYAIVVPGDAEASELVLRILDEDDPMPPRDSEPLTAAERDLLRRWVEEGATWPAHWAFEAPLRTPAPPVARADWPKDPLDHYVLARLEAAGLEPAPEAEPAAWLRRASFDLTGLPPSPEELRELESAVADKGREAAYAEAVDRLLASPRYGERRAQDWLDVARYADSNGNQFDEPRTQWKWRDWVIEAFNANKPYDEFTVEQLAGDLLPKPTLDQRVATGFNRNHPTDTDNPAERDEYRTEYVIDRVHTTSTAFLGLTMACVQCHDHKYDPFDQEDYYSFYAFFNSVAEWDVDMGNPRPKLRVPNPDQAPLLADLERRVKDLETRLESDDPLLDQEQARWEAATLERLGPSPEWTPVQPVGLISRNGAHLVPQDDGSILSAGPTPVKDTYDLVLQPGPGTIHALKLEVLPDETHGGKTGRASDGRFHLSRIEVRHASLTEGIAPPPVVIAAAQADLRQRRDRDKEVHDNAAVPGDVASAFSGQPVDPDGGGGFFSGGGWALVNEAMGEAHEAVLVPREPLKLNEASVLRISMHQTGGRQKSLVGRFRWSITDDERVREQLLPMVGGAWSTLGPFEAPDIVQAFGQDFGPEADLKKGLSLRKRYAPPKPPEPEGKGKGKPDAKGGPQKDAKPGQEGAEKPKEGEAKPGEEKAEGEAREKDRGDDDEEEDEDEDEEEARSEREPRKLAWQEQPTWRDGSRASLSGTGVHYLTRKVTSDKARTAVLRLDGPAALKVWLNGEPVFEDEPRAPGIDEAKKKAAAEAGEDEGFGGFFFGRRDVPDRTARLGFRAGENELVVKALFPTPKRQQGGPPGGGGMSFGRRSGGASITFDLTPEGEDLLDYEVIAALRAKAEGRPEPDHAGVDEASYAADAIPRAPVEHLTRDERLRRHFRSKVSTFGRVLHDQLAAVRKEKAEFEKDIPEVMVMEDLETPRKTHVFHRGDFRHPRQEVHPRTPTALPPMGADLPKNRLGLARWIASPDNPLTARVAVNRIWQQHFETGLVATPDDFGLRGELPSHPRLLDTLARDFVEGGWDMKALHRRLVLSASYRQACVTSPEKLEADPENRLVSRGPRQRLSAEMLRDNALYLAGLLVEKVGGPPVKPYQAKGLWSEVTGGGDWKADKGEKQYRRGVYVYRKRRVPYASMKTFDRGSGDTCVVARAETITPLQALVLLNNPVFVEASRKLAERILTEGGDDDAARLDFAFRLCTSRAPRAEELTVLTELVTTLRKTYADDPKAAKKLLGVGDAKAREGLDPKEVAAWAGVANAMLNLDAALSQG